MIGIRISILLVIMKCSWCISLDQLYPFGPDEDDQMLDPSSDRPTFTNADFTFEFNSRQELYVC